MKNAIIYLLLILFFLGLTYFVNRGAKPEFNWEATYSQHDKQPFGAYVLDDVLGASLKESYTHSYKSIYQLLNEEDIQGQNLMILTDQFSPSGEDLSDLFQYVKDGNNVMIGSSYFSYSFLDSLNLATASSSFSTYISSKVNIREHLETISFYGVDSQAIRYRFPTVMLEAYFKPHKEEPVEAETNGDSIEIGIVNPQINIPYRGPVTVLAEEGEHRPILLKYQIGKGYLILSTTPKMFTNYGVLDSVNGGFVWQTLGYLTNQPLIRTENYKAGTDESQSPLRYILSNRALKWGLYISLIAVVLFMIFTAKRKQKAIPVIKSPENKMISFVRSIAALYLRKSNNADIVRKKYTYWADRIRQQYGMDIINSNHDREFCLQFASKTGQLPDKIVDLFKQLDAIQSDSRVSDEEMKNIIERMNLIN